MLITATTQEMWELYVIMVGSLISETIYSLTLKLNDPQRSVMRLMLDWLMAGLLMMDGWRYVLRGCGDLCVTTVGMKEMLKWCVDNWDMMEVSLLGNNLY